MNSFSTLSPQGAPTREHNDLLTEGQAKHIRECLGNPRLMHELRGLLGADGSQMARVALAQHDEIARLRAVGQELADHEIEWTRCSICHELLESPESGDGDGELLGHTSDCPVAGLLGALER